MRDDAAPVAERPSAAESTSGRTAAERPAAPRVMAVRWGARIVIVPLASIVRIDACDNYVCIVAERSYRHREPLTRLCARLPAGTFLRVHRSHAVNVAAVRELRARTHGEYAIVLADGSALVSGRAYRDAIEQAFGLHTA